MGTQPVTESDFNVLQFEKQLITLKDSQDAINNCCKWCLEHRTHHKKIVNAWLNVLKRVKVEQRLILFYLANDVVQYSKRRNYEYVESWGTALQKATTMVRDEKVKHKVLRIFKIWEQRNVYNEEFISDLCGLLSVVPSGSKNDEPHEFQPTYVINKIKTCSKLERDTDIKMKVLKEHNPNIHFEENLLVSLKDRAHVDDVEKEVEVYIKHMEDYINALKLEIKNRIGLISVLKQADIQLEADRKDVKVVANAYRMFGTRVKTFQKKLEEHKQTLTSPVPSPDINAPSPTSDTDIDLPEEDLSAITSGIQKTGSPASYNPKAELQYAAGFYNSVSSVEKDSSSFLTNGFSSFMGSDVQFNVESLSSTLFNNAQTEPTQDLQRFTPPLHQNPPLPVEAPVVTPTASTNYSYSSSSHEPLLPPPMPPFSKSEMEYGNSSFDLTYTSSTSYDLSYSTSAYDTTANYNTANASQPSGLFQEDSFEPPLGANPYPPNEGSKYSSEEYNPEETSETWEQQEPSWNDRTIDLDTPESPPMFEKEGYSDPVEYHDNAVHRGIEDVDHRILPNITEDSLGSLGMKDVDHRNLITLTESPGNSNSDSPNVENSWIQADQDYRVPPTPVPVGDQDYRMSFNIEQLKLPPPPPPPPKTIIESPAPPPPLSPEPDMHDFPNRMTSKKSPRKNDNIEDIDMDLSDEDFENRLQTKHDNLKVIIGGSNEEQRFSLEPPPPLPDLPDDVDANNFLDDLSNDLHEFTNLSDDLDGGNVNETNAWNQGPLLPPPVMNFDIMGTALTSAPPPPLNTAAPLNSTPHSINFSSPPISSIPPPMNFSPPRPNSASFLNTAPPMNSSIRPPNPTLNMHSYSTLPPPINPPPPMPPFGIMPPPIRSDWMKDEGILWEQDQELNPYIDDGYGEDEIYMMSSEQHMMEQNWSGPPPPPPPGHPNFNFRGRGNMNRGNFLMNKRGWGRGGNNNRGGNFRPRGFRGNRGNRSRGNFRGNFRGGY